MHAVRLGALVVLTVLSGCAHRHPTLVAAPPSPPPPATNLRTLVETPPPATLPEPPLPALKPGTELSLAESEALADQASPKAPAETQGTASQRAMGRMAGQAAKPSGRDAPPLTVEQLVGLGKSDAAKLFGPPAESIERPLYQIWIYHSAVCDVTLFFYPEIGGPAFRALTYQIDERSAANATHHTCLASLTMPRARLRS
jgi:hypothetical protein